MLALLGVVVAFAAAPLAVAPAAAAPGDITVNNATVNEGDGSVLIEVMVEAPYADLTATLSTTNGSAINGEDFTSSAQTVPLSAGVNWFSLPITDDLLDEDSETFAVQVSNPSEPVSLVDASAAVTIVDNDAEPILSITPSASTSEGDTGMTTLGFEVSLNVPSGRYVGVFISASNGTALAGSDYESISGSFTFAPGVTTMPFNVQVFGESVYETDQTFTVTLSSPANASIAGAVGTGTILNDDAAPVLTVSGDLVSEFFDWATVTVTRTGGTEIPITVDYATANDSATAPGDYTATSGGLTFAPSTASVVTQTVTVPIAEDNVIEPTYEWFTFALSNPVGATAGAAASVRITDDDTPTVSITDVTHVELDSGGTDFEFTVSLDRATTSTVEVQYALSDAGATGGTDYVNAVPTGTVTFAPGDVSETITVFAFGDTVYEADQDFHVTLSLPVNATLGAATGVGRILNNDAPPELALSPTTVSVPEGDAGGTDLTFTVTRAGATDLPVTVQYEAVAGSATAPDFVAASGVLTIAPSLNGTETASFTVRVNGDTTREAAETFRVLLSLPTAASLATDTAVITISDDDAVGGGLAQTGSTSPSPATLFGALLLIAAGAGVALVGRRPWVASSLLRSAREGRG